MQAREGLLAGWSPGFSRLKPGLQHKAYQPGVGVSDHGFAPYEKFIRPNVVLKELGLIETDAKDKVTNRKAWCVAQGG